VICSTREVVMPRALPVELRNRVVKAWEEGEGSFRELAERFGVGEASVNRWVALQRNTGSVAPRKAGGARRPRLIDKDGEAFLAKRLREMPDLTLGELAVAYERFCGVKVSTQRMSEAVRRIGFTRKKGSFVR